MPNQMTLAPDQHETERLLSDSLSHGDKSAIANILEVSLSEISQQCNPEEPYKSCFYRFKRFIWALSAVNQDAATLLIADLQVSLQNWIGHRVDPRSVEALTGEFAQEATSLIRGRLEGKPEHVLRTSALEARAALDKVLDALGNGEAKAKLSRV